MTCYSRNKIDLAKTIPEGHINVVLLLTAPILMVFLRYHARQIEIGADLHNCSLRALNHCLWNFQRHPAANL
jgi:hypothetical protein